MSTTETVHQPEIQAPKLSKILVLDFSFTDSTYIAEQLKKLQPGTKIDQQIERLERLRYDQFGPRGSVDCGWFNEDHRRLTFADLAKNEYGTILYTPNSLNDDNLVSTLEELHKVFPKTRIIVNYADGGHGLTSEHPYETQLKQDCGIPTDYEMSQRLSTIQNITVYDGPMDCLGGAVLGAVNQSQLSK